MGTRCDFYVGRGKDMEWIGSYPWDGYPGGVEKVILEAKDEKAYRTAVCEKIAEKGTLPSRGWPWPWPSSATTDFAYTFDEGKVWFACFARGWFDPSIYNEEDCEKILDGPKTVEFPDMKAIQKITMGPRSGLICITPDGIQGEENP
jgi:hypothetical protein